MRFKVFWGLVNPETPRLMWAHGTGGWGPTWDATGETSFMETGVSDMPLARSDPALARLVLPAFLTIPTFCIVPNPDRTRDLIMGSLALVKFTLLGI